VVIVKVLILSNFDFALSYSILNFSKAGINSISSLTTSIVVVGPAEGWG